MKTLLFLFLSSISIFAQNHPFVFRSELKTNPPISIASSGVTIEHSITVVSNIAYVGILTEKGIMLFEQPAMSLAGIITNIPGKPMVQKPIKSSGVVNTNKPPAVVNTNSIPYRKAHNLPPFDKK